MTAAGVPVNLDVDVYVGGASVPLSAGVPVELHSGILVSFQHSGTTACSLQTLPWGAANLI